MNERDKELAEQAGLLGPSSRVDNAHESAEKFAEFIRADERDACAKVCEAMNHYVYDGKEFAAAIRASGNT